MHCSLLNSLLISVLLLAIMHPDLEPTDGGMSMRQTESAG